MNTAFTSIKSSSKLRAFVKGAIAIVVFFLLLGISGQIYISYPKRSTDELFTFSESIRLWHEILYSIISIILFVAAIIVVVDVIRILPEVGGIINNRLLVLEQTLKQIGAASESVRMLDKLPDMIRKPLDLLTKIR